MPARRAMSSVDVPSKPRSANSTRAASRTSSLRSAAVSLVVVISTRRRLVMTHKLVKCLRDPVELAVGEAGVERQREGALEGGVGAREVALVAVGAQAVEGVGPDLALDPLGSEAVEHLVAAVDLDHVGLEPVHVAIVDARQDDVEAREALGVAGGDTLVGRAQRLEPAELRDAERAENVAEAVVEGGVRHVLVGARGRPAVV